MDTASVLDDIEQLAERWAGERDERLQRRRLDRGDFDAIAATGFLRLIVPESLGGLWRSLAETGPALIEAVRRLARGDHSVALVASMHPSVLIYWAGTVDAPEPFAESWTAQRHEVFQSALDGHFWGTIASEPGSGGDVQKTKARATPVKGSVNYQLYGAKHFGSGSELVSYMITAAKPDGAEGPMGFYLDLRDQPWDGTGGLTITRPWDGVGMKATQSHAIHLDGIEATPWAWPEVVVEGSATSGALGISMYCGVIAAVVDAAMVETERRLAGRALRSYEDVAWTQAQIDRWMLTQAQHGVVRALASNPPTEAIVAANKAKMGMAALAESILSGVSRAVGGGAFSASSPYASWYEDVRALGYLRPPWALAFDQLSEARQNPDPT